MLEWLFWRGEVLVSGAQQRLRPALRPARAGAAGDGAGDADARRGRRVSGRWSRSRPGRWAWPTRSSCATTSGCRCSARAQAIRELVDAGELIPVDVGGSTQPVLPAPRTPSIPRRVSRGDAGQPVRSDRLEPRRAPSACSTSTTASRSTCRPPQRVHGYYVLPFLLGDRLVARVDLKADRQAGVLRVPGAFAEPGAPAHTASALAAELVRLAGWLGLERRRPRRSGAIWRGRSMRALRCPRRGCVRPVYGEGDSRRRREAGGDDGHGPRGTRAFCRRAGECRRGLPGLCAARDRPVQPVHAPAVVPVAALVRAAARCSCASPAASPTRSRSTRPPSGAFDSPTCLVKMTTGFDCPGCGGTRAFWYLLHGDVAGRGPQPPAGGVRGAVPGLHVHRLGGQPTIGRVKLPYLRLSSRRSSRSSWASGSSSRSLAICRGRRSPGSTSDALWRRQSVRRAACQIRSSVTVGDPRSRGSARVRSAAKRSWPLHDKSQWVWTAGSELGGFRRQRGLGDPHRVASVANRRDRDETASASARGATACRLDGRHGRPVGRAASSHRRDRAPDDRPTVMSPLAVRTCRRRLSSVPAGAASATASSLRVSPVTELRSSQTAVPSATPTVTSPEAAWIFAEPLDRSRSRMSPDAVVTWADPPTASTSMSPLADRAADVAADRADLHVAGRVHEGGRCPRPW